MPSSDRAGLKQAFAHLRKPEEDEEAERKLLGRTIESPAAAEAATAAEPRMVATSYQVATDKHVLPPSGASVGNASGGLIPRPMLKREPERQLSFRCPVSLAAELQRKARFNQLEQQQILKEGLRRVLAELSDPPEGWIG